MIKKKTNTTKAINDRKTIKIIKTNKEMQPNTIMKAGLIISIVIGLAGLIPTILMLIGGIFVTNSNPMWSKMLPKINTTVLRVIFIIFSSMWLIIDIITIMLCIMILTRKSDSNILTGIMALISGLLIGGILILLGQFEKVEKKEVHVVT